MEVLLRLILMVYFFVGVESVGTGKVVIGKTPDALAAEGKTSNPSVYSFSKNEAPTNLPVYLTISPDGTPYDSNVQLSCENVLGTNPIGYTGITFTNPVLTLAAGTISGTVSFTIDTAGRGIEVQCYGVSQGGAGQFTKDGSMSDKVSVQVTVPATVSFCSDTVTVPNFAQTVSASFELKLSEPLKDNNVKINCIPSNVAVGSLNITIPDQEVIVGSSVATMTYTITSASGADISVQCSAVSSNAGQQYLAGTSASSATFTEDKAVIKFYPPTMQVTKKVFETILYLNEPLPSTVNVKFACTTSFINSINDANSVLTNYICVDVENITQTESNVTEPEWVIVNRKPPIFEFKSGESMKLIRVERNLTVSTDTVEYVLLVCCVPESINSSPKYVNQTSSTIISVRMTPGLPVDMATATDALNVAETPIANPAFVRLAPCPCDLTNDACDIGCCCDVNCTEEYKRLFDCIPGIFGGATQNSHKDESCLSDPYPKPNWHKLLCVVSEENPLLGWTYSTTPIVKTNALFTEKEQSASKQDNFAENGSRSFQENINTTIGYTRGISIRTQTQGDNSLKGILSLPLKSLDGRCQRNSAVRFLTDTVSECVVRMTEAVCKDSASSFNARTYMQNPDVELPSCPAPLGVATRPITGAPNAAVRANYRCTTNVAPYIIQKFQPVQSKSSTFAGFNRTVLDKCSFNEYGLFDCLPSSVTPVTTIPHCSFDTGQNLPPVPSWDATNAKNPICRNAVLQVQYTFHWSGPSIESVTADYVLGNIRAPTTYSDNVVTTETVLDPISGTKVTKTTTKAELKTFPTDVTQKYRAQFVQASPPNKPQSPDILPEISGNPGYHPYLPLIGAVKLNTTTWDADKKYWPRYFAPNYETQECTKVGKDLVLFDEAVSGSCLLYLSLQDFSECDRLRRYLLSLLDPTMPMEYMSMVGNPNRSEPSHWITVDRQNLSNIIDVLPPTNKALTGLAASSSRCPSMPVGISLNVMYADSGQLADRYIQRLVHARVVYQLADLYLKCSGSMAADCIGGATNLQPFSLSSSATYFLVPSVFPGSSRRAQYYSQCTQEICINEAMFPFTRGFQGGTYEESLLWMIAIIGVTLFIFMITKPWW